MVYKYWVGGALDIIDDKSLGGKQRRRYQGIATRSSRFSTDISLAVRDQFSRPMDNERRLAGILQRDRMHNSQPENNEATLQFTGLVSRLPWPTPLLIRTPNCCCCYYYHYCYLWSRVRGHTCETRHTRTLLVETSINFDKDWPK